MQEDLLFLVFVVLSLRVCESEGENIAHQEVQEQSEGIVELMVSIHIYFTFDIWLTHREKGNFFG